MYTALLLAAMIASGPNQYEDYYGMTPEEIAEHVVRCDLDDKGIYQCQGKILSDAECIQITEDPVIFCKGIPYPSSERPNVGQKSA